METVENCYFYIEGDSEENQRMRVMCVGCSQSNPGVGWFYDAKAQGYGPFRYACSKCEKVIYEHPESEQHETNS